MNKKICPYPGLRPFTVEESFFFKGRDIHIRQIINKLETNKILILTGASGDGKSSLVYAGVMPNARAGFFRAKYNKWIFADFRPERSPLQNLAKVISQNLKIDYKFTENELSYGFSGLIDLYKTSSFYIDEESDEWENATQAEKKQRQLKAANLFILADQFEEFFTNAENFYDGKASGNAYTTVNLLLETARIALRDNIPVYVICTLRSDFISQCIAFRGLPETIGFSQFFVPRLNRTELQQVIEEPAILSGGKVTKRLKELLINELHDGFDQLPLLQHTLKQLWTVADNGNEDLDLIHLAKVGGLESKFLIDEDRKNYDLWYKGLKASQKKYYENPSSSNVLNAHADSLYDTAFEYFLSNFDWAEKNISEDDARLIIKTSFQCLTKIDERRAVRNRTTLEEITNIINLPHIKIETVCAVLNIFRLQDSTFLRPFIQDNDIATQYLSYDTVLDITHEALIRNWENLEKWNGEDSANITYFKEFEIQLNRWLENNKSTDFLLPIGPLSHFEDWYNRCKPNKYWLAKYDAGSQKYESKLRKAEKLSDDSIEFLTTSRKHIIATEKAKKLRRRMMFVGALVLILILSGFSYWALQEKSNAETQKQLAEQQTDSARIQRNRALEANRTAEQQRSLAENNAKKALFSKRQSDSARSLAEFMKSIAEEKTQLAKKEAENAKHEKQIADEQSNIANQQKKRAELASDSAKSLSYLAIAQSLSFKATQKFDDKQINLLLALQAFNFNKKYNGFYRDPAIFNALRFTSLNFIENNKIQISSNPFSSYLFNQNNLLIICKNGSFIKYDLKNNKTFEQNDNYLTSIPINSSFFLTEQLILICLENRQLYLQNFQTGIKMDLTGHSDYVRTITFNKEKNYLATAGRDKTLLIWKINTENIQIVTTFKADSRITAIAFSNNGNMIYAGTISGDLMEFDIENNKQTLVNSNNSSILSLQISPDSKFLVTGYSNGTIRIFDKLNLKSFKPVSLGSSGIRFISFDNTSHFLATASDDKTIQIFDIFNFDKNPIIINDINQRIAGMTLVNDKLYAWVTDNSFLFWESNPEKYAEKVKQKLTRNFTPTEWNLFVGEKIPYESTK